MQRGLIEDALGGGLSLPSCGESEAGLPFAGDEVGHALGGVGVDSHQDVTEAGERIDAGQFARGDQAVQDPRGLVEG
jgi:hypothetical protein